MHVICGGDDGGQYMIQIHSLPSGGFMCSCDTWHWFGKSNSDALEEQQVLLNTETSL